ncbi:MAG: M15 family metallopeptidase [Oscillospiraceae bacterium]|nr:M15 family metallopeptidase [Oscillospiraceae bacterium]
MKLFRPLCALALCAALALPAGALAAGENTEKYPDLPESYWAYADMTEAVRLGILKGLDDGRMAPEDILTWGQYLVMLTRAIYPEEYALQLNLGTPWDMAGYDAAKETGLLLENEFLPVSPSTLSQPILRQDAAVLLDRLLLDLDYKEMFWSAPSDNGDDWETPTAANSFSDWDTLDENHQAAVTRLFEAVIVKGRTDGTFDGGETIKRADGTVLLMRALPLAEMRIWGEPKDITLRLLDQEGGLLVEDKVIPAELGALTAELADLYAPKHYAAVDGGATVTRARDLYAVTMRPFTQAELDEEAYYEKLSAGQVTQAEYDSQNFWLRKLGENDQKKILLFGTASKRRYSSRSEAEQYMVTITVPMWRIDKEGNKYSSEGSFLINAAIAEDTVALFTEIYNDPEQFPIRDLGGYGWRGDKATGEHNTGTAIDINWNENYQIRNGRIQTGSLWQPGSNPYSIGPNSSVVRIFREHGWSWGGDAWADNSDDSYGYHDYMHFSYMGW